MVLHSLRLGARKVLRYPGVFSITFLTLTIGIAVSATIFAVTWATLVRPFPFRGQERLLMLWVDDVKSDVHRLEISYDELEQIGKESRMIESIGGLSAANFPVVLKRRNEPMQLSANIIDPKFFSTLGAAPAQGRAFHTAEFDPNAAGAAILSHRAWRERFGGDANVLKETVVAPGAPPIPIVGILPPNFPLPAGAEILFPLSPPNDRGNRVLTAVARMKPGVTIDAVRRELAVIGEHVQAAHPDRHHEVILPYPLVDEILGATKPALRIVFAMGMLVLVIALFNVASVALAQGVTRISEIGVRGAVGATRWSCMVRFFLEACVLTVASAVAGFVLARVLLTMLLRIAPADTPRIAEVSIGGPALAFAIGAALLAALLAAAAQAFRARDAEILTALRASSKSTSHRGARRMLEILAGTQTAVAIVTLVVAALLVQSFRRYASIDVGFSTANTVTFHLGRGYMMSADLPGNRNFFGTAHENIRKLSGVTASGSVLMRPLEVEQGWDFTFTLDGQSAVEQERNPLSNFLDCTPGYFDAMGMTLLRGRGFTENDGPDAPKVAVIGESFARRYWTDPQTALGKRLKSGKPDSKAPWMTIVGVVKDVRSRSLTTEKYDLYVPYTQSNWSPNYFAVRTSGSPEAVMPAVRQILTQLDAGSPVSLVKTTGQLVDAKLAQPRLAATIVVLFAITATFLALIGFYGMLAYVVRERTPEMGVRMAVGADASSLRTMIVRRASLIALGGIAAGVVLSIALDRVWRGYVFGADGIDVRLLVAVAIGFQLIAAIASLIPAARAASTDAAAALRAE
jgi:putative ABC transport system permease protein